MRTLALAAAVGLLLLSAPAASAQAEVALTFVDPQRFTDIGAYGDDGERNLGALERHFKALGERCLRAGETLELQVFDVDLAGRDEWWHRGAYDVRVMRDITWPSVDVGYVRRDAAGTVLSEGRERVADMTYLWRSAYVRHDSDALPYEKAMIRDWYERRFCPKGRELSAR